MKTLYYIFLMIILSSFSITSYAHIQNCCSVTCKNGSCEAYGDKCVCTCSPNTGFPSCGNLGRMMANPTQAANMLDCKSFCLGLGSTGGNNAAETYQQIYNLLSAHNFDMAADTEGFATLQSLLNNLNLIINNSFSTDEKNNLFNFISSLAY